MQSFICVDFSTNNKQRTGNIIRYITYHISTPHHPKDGPKHNFIDFNAALNTEIWTLNSKVFKQKADSGIVFWCHVQRGRWVAGWEFSKFYHECLLQIDFFSRNCGKFSRLFLCRTQSKRFEPFLAVRAGAC